MGKTGVLVGLDLPSDGRTEVDVRSPHGSNCLDQRRNNKWNENQTVLATAIHTPERDVGPLESAVAGSWNIVILKHSQGEGCC